MNTGWSIIYYSPVNKIALSYTFVDQNVSFRLSHFNFHNINSEYLQFTIVRYYTTFSAERRSV